MTVKLVDLHRSGADRYVWVLPFDRAAVYANEHWWGTPSVYDDSPHPSAVETLSKPNRFWSAVSGSTDSHSMDNPGGSIARLY